MKPYYQDDYVTLYHGDALEVLPGVKQGFDLVLTDPPYGLNKKMSGGTWGSSQKYQEQFRWDVLNQKAVDTLISYPKVIIWGGNYYQLPPSRCWLIWEKKNKMPTMADFEMAWTNFDRCGKMFTSYRNVKSNNHRQHASQKPVELLTWCIHFADNVNTILDPFGGSGTTGVAAKELNKKCVLIEIEEKYCEIAARRLSQEVFNFGEL